MAETGFVRQEPCNQGDAGGSPELKLIQRNIAWLFCLFAGSRGEN